MADNIDGVITPGASGLTGAYPEYSSSLHSWLREALEEGIRINRLDPAFAKLDDTIAYIQGRQPATAAEKAGYLPNIILNQLKKAIKAHASALTDVRPLFAWRTMNPRYAEDAHVLNQYAVMWWVNTNADRVLSDAIKYSLAGGSGDLLLQWDQNFLGGESRMIAQDPRDTIPFRPERVGSLADWEGVTLREPHSVNRLRRIYPDRVGLIKEDTGRLPLAAGRFYSATNPERGGPTYTLDGLTGGNPLRRRERYSDLRDGYPECTLYRTYVHDPQVHLGKEVRIMGKPHTNWSYPVEPGQKLYPRGRLVLWTEHGIIYDGPNPYWSGVPPVGRLKLDPWPWLFGGMGLMNDLRGNQDAINYLVNDLLILLSQHVNRGAHFDKSVPEGVFHRWDPRRPNWKVRKPNAFSKGIELTEVPQAPPWALPLLQLMFNKFEELSGTANLASFMQLRQMPGAETIEKYLNALTPEIRDEGRQVEVCLRDVAMMVKSNLFQFVSKERRYSLLGDAGMVVQDLDWDPDTMIPAMSPQDDGYVPDLDKSRSRDDRARFYLNQFAFYAQPGSMLNYTSTERKMLYTQLARQGYMDVWTLGETLEVPNMGTPPPMQLPPADWDPEEHPNEEPPLVWRIPRTVTERLQAQQQMNIGQTVSPAGRKASGQAPPKLEQKSDGRTTVSESR